jgi:hypothetical protein
MITSLCLGQKEGDCVYYVVLTALENDDDLILLSSLKEEKVLAYQKLDIYNLTNDQCRTMIRFGREDINILSNALQLPEKIISRLYTYT